MKTLLRCLLAACLVGSLGIAVQSLAPDQVEATELTPVEAVATTLGARTPSAGDRVRSSSTVELAVAISARMGKHGDKVSNVESTRTMTRVVELGEDAATVEVEYPSASYQRATDGKEATLPVPTVGQTYRVELGEKPTVTKPDGLAVTDRERATVAADAHLLRPVVVAPDAAGKALEPGALLALPDTAVAALLPLSGKLTVARADAAYLGTTTQGDRAVAVFEVAIATTAETDSGTLTVDLAGHLGVDVETGWARRVELEGSYHSRGKADGALAFNTEGTLRYTAEAELVTPGSRQ